MRRKFFKVEVCIEDLDLDDDEIIELAEEAGLICYKPSGGVRPNGLDALCDQISTRLWSPSEWDQLQNAIANAVVVPRRRMA